ncbi:toprim domain-containing protein, partial [Staphylococcus aureus]|nr:toprim domain-containing protein [Staphylococcus aureus]
VEGYMDVLALAQHGVDYVVATLGTATTQQHIQQLFRFADQIYFCFDGDQAGRKAAWKALTQALTLIKENKHIYFIF